MLVPADVRLDSCRLDDSSHPPYLATLSPAVSWRVKHAMGSDEYETGGSSPSGDRLTQNAYRIQVARDAGFNRIAWDSGWVESAESLAIRWGGDPLEPLSHYRIRVAAEDGAGRRGDWSDPQAFSTAAVGIGWDLPFITAPTSLMPPEESRPGYLYREFSLDEVPERALLLATAVGLYEVWINGHRVGEDLLAPGWTAYRHRIASQTYDVTGLLSRGSNAIGVVLGYGWYAGDLTWLDGRNLYGSRPAVSCAILDGDAAGGATSLRSSSIVSTSDASQWVAAHGPIVYSELYHGEEYDARLEDAGWCTPGRTDSSWEWSPCETLDESRSISARVEPQDGPPVRRQEELPPQRVFTTPAGETVVDFGQNLTGWVRFSPVGNAGETVVLSHAEILDASGNFYTENLRSARNRVSYTLGDRPDAVFEPHFTFQGFRYVRIDAAPAAMLAGITENPARYMTAIVVHSEMETTLAFSCSDRRINQLHHNIVWGWKGNAVDIPTDCPQRDERLGWTGDAQVFIGTAAYLTDVRGFFRKWLRDLALEQRSDGGVPFVVPDVLADVMHRDPNIQATHSSTGWGDAAVICPMTLLDRYGDRETVERQYPSMRRWIDFIRERAEDGVLWNTGFHFGDWVALDAEEGSFFGATPNDLTATAYYARSTELTARAAELLGRIGEAEELRSLHRDIVAAFQRTLFSESGRLTAQTQTAHLLALAFGLVPERFRSSVVEDLIATIRANGNHLVTGFLGTPLLLPVLADNDHLDEAYRLLLREEYPSWLYQVLQGATTIWEHWDGMKPDGTMWSPEMNSFNHYAYGAVGEWIYRTVGGLDLNRSSISDREFRIAPRPGGGITSSEMTYRSPYGEVRVAWRVSGERLQVQLDLPPNTTAVLALPGASEESLGPGRTERVVTIGDRR